MGQGRSSPPVAGAEQGPGSFWPSLPEPLMHLPSWSMHGGPRAAAAAPSPPFPPSPAIGGVRSRPRC